jgi:hypothetical protein
MATPFSLGGQDGWSHDEGHPAGSFHTYDHLDVSQLFPPRAVHVLVPRGPAPPGGFPSLYLHDGDTAFWPGGAFGKTWDVAGVLSALHGAIAPRVVVAVHPLDRNLEYTHADWSGGRRSWGGLAAHTDYLADGIAGFVQAHYPVSPRREHTAVAGSSHGGLAAFWAATRRPDRFGAAGCFSPSFFTGLDDLVPEGSRPVALRTAPLVTGAEAVLADPGRRPRLWMCWGLRRTGGEHNAVVEHLATLRGREMRDLLIHDFGYRAAPWPDRAELTWAEVAEHGHDEAAWHEQLGWFLASLALRT